jgi:hypothetical protein
MALGNWTKIRALRGATGVTLGISVYKYHTHFGSISDRTFTLFLPIFAAAVVFYGLTVLTSMHFLSRVAVASIGASFCFLGATLLDSRSPLLTVATLCCGLAICGIGAKGIITSDVGHRLHGWWVAITEG